MMSTEHRQMHRFLKTALFFCLFCAGYGVLIGVDMPNRSQPDTLIAATDPQAAEDAALYAEMGIIAPAAGQP